MCGRDALVRDHGSILEKEALLEILGERGTPGVQADCFGLETEAWFMAATKIRDRTADIKSDRVPFKEDTLPNRHGIGKGVYKGPSFQMPYESGRLYLKPQTLAMSAWSVLGSPGLLAIRFIGNPKFKNTQTCFTLAIN